MSHHQATARSIVYDAQLAEGRSDDEGTERVIQAAADALAAAAIQELSILLDWVQNNRAIALHDVGYYESVKKQRERDVAQGEANALYKVREQILKLAPALKE